AYSTYRAHTSGTVMSPCGFSVTKILSIGGDVKVKIAPPTISMQFPDGTPFAAATDGTTFQAQRVTMFKFSDGCNWQATETLAGTIDVAGQCTMTATYQYREMPLTMGVPCAKPCTVDANVEITRTAIM